MSPTWICSTLDRLNMRRPLVNVNSPISEDFLDSIAPSYLSVQRMLLDVPARRLLLGSVDKDALRAERWNEFNLEARGGGPYFRLRHTLYGRAAAFDGLKVLRMGDLDMGALHRVVDAERPVGARLLAKLDRYEWTGCRCDVVKNGRPHRAYFPGVDRRALDLLLKEYAKGIDFSVHPNGPQCIFAGGSPFPLQPGVNVIQSTATLKNVPSSWTKPRPGDSTIVIVPTKKGRSDRPVVRSRSLSE